MHPRQRRAALQQLGCRQRSVAMALYPSQKYPTSRNTINSSVLGALKEGRGASNLLDPLLLSLDLCGMLL